MYVRCQYHAPPDLPQEKLPTSLRNKRFYDPRFLLDFWENYKFFVLEKQGQNMNYLLF
jgi:hypothetical protein